MRIFFHVGTVNGSPFVTVSTSTAANFFAMSPEHPFSSSGTIAMPSGVNTSSSGASSPYAALRPPAAIRR